MPSYDIDIPGQGSYTVDSERELTDQEVYDSIMGQQGTAPQAETPQPERGFFERSLGADYDPNKNFISNYANITGRRVGSAVDALVDLPSSLSSIVTGDLPEVAPPEGLDPISRLIAGFTGQPRIQAALRSVQGVASPISALLAPVEAAVEEPVSAFAGNDWGKLAGDVGGLAATAGLGLLSKAGKLGPTAEALAKVFGVGREREFQDMIRHDPQMAYIAERPYDIATEDIAASSRLERAARGEASLGELTGMVEELKKQEGKSTAQLAAELNRPVMAEMELNKLAAENKQWLEYAKENDIPFTKLPDDPTVEVGKILFTPETAKDIGVVQMLGTPATRAAAISRRLGQVGFEMQLTDTNIGKATEARVARNKSIWEGMSDDQVRRGVIAWHTHPDTFMDLPERLLDQTTKNWLQQILNKVEIDRQIVVPRQRDMARARISASVDEQFGNLSDVVKEAEVNRRLEKAFPANVPLEDHLLQIFGGKFEIKDAKGTTLDFANNRLDALMKIWDIARSGVSADDIKVDTKLLLKGDLLRTLKQNRISQTWKNLANSMDLTPEEIKAAAKGQFAIQKLAKGFSLFDSFRGSGSSKGFAQDLLDTFNAFDGQIEKWLQIRQLHERVDPVLKELQPRYPQLVQMLRDNLNLMWGSKNPLSQPLDNTIASVPLLRDIVAPGILERFLARSKGLLVSGLLKWNPHFHGVNLTQTFATLWPIADGREILQGLQLKASEAGQKILERHLPATSKVEIAAGKVGFSEKFNQETAFLTMYNRARKIGFSDAQAADYAKLRGNIYSQFMGLTTDQPIWFRKIDPTGTLFMFQRFPVKQAELLIDLLKDKNIPGAAKFMGVNFLIGGFKAATLGNAGWLTYKMYKDIEDQYGKGMADFFHAGLPALAGVDLSGSVQLYNMPFGQNLPEKIINMAQGPLIGLASSVIGNMLDQTAPEPMAAKRAFDAFAQKIPMAGWLQDLVKFWNQDYDFKDPGGRLNFKGDLRDLWNKALGFKSYGGEMGVTETEDPNTMRPGMRETFIDAMMEMRSRRDDIINYAAQRYGMAMATGVDLGKDMEDLVEKEVDKWNNFWPEFPITEDDIMKRAEARRDVAIKGVAQRVRDRMPKAIKASSAFDQPNQAPYPDALSKPPDLPFEFFGGGG